MSMYNLKGLVGTEPGEVKKASMDVKVIDGKLFSAGVAYGHQTPKGNELVSDGGPERIQGWGSLNNRKAFYIREQCDGSRALLVPMHEFERIGVDPRSLRTYSDLEQQATAD